MRSTPFPATPCDVVTLSVPEFTGELDVNTSASLDAVCRRFLEDTNRAVVWFIRSRALKTWSERMDVAQWLRSEPSHADRARELAASFDLNDAWEFDAERFRSAVESVVR
jgi:ABC-type iron transport system FetAB ATPase subunit